VGRLRYAPAGPKLVDLLEAALVSGRDQRHANLLPSLIEAVGALRVEEAAPLLAVIAQTEVGLRGKAVQALAVLGSAEAAPLLAKMFADPSPRLRESLIGLMVEAGYKPALPLIRPLLGDPNASLRSAALEAVARFRDPAARSPVRSLCFRDPNPFVRVQALGALVALEGRQALPDLLALAGDLNTRLRLAVANHLAALKPLPEAGLEALRRLAEDGDDGVAAAAGAALENLPAAGPHESAQPPAAPAPPRIPAPPALQADLPQLLALLKCWQAALPSQAAGHGLDEIAAVEAALARLIEAVEATPGLPG
jgi:HEAT repeat protein